MSLRSNNLEYLPDEIGRIPRLRVLNLSDNKLRCLPYSLIRLKELQALWLSENQVWLVDWIKARECKEKSPYNPDSKVHGANMGPTWGRQDPGGPHVGPMNFAIWEV